MELYHLIFLENSKVILSKKPYSDWKEIQSEFDTYISSLDFNSRDELIEYLSTDYKIPFKLIKHQIDEMDKTKLEQIELNL